MTKFTTKPLNVKRPSSSTARFFWLCFFY